MESLDEKKVLHIANLAKLKLDESEVKKYVKDLNDLMNEIKKIEDVEINDDILIAPVNNTNVYNEDNVGEMLSREEILKNANKKYGSFIATSRALND